MKKLYLQKTLLFVIPLLLCFSCGKKQNSVTNDANVSANVDTTHQYVQLSDTTLLKHLDNDMKNEEDLDDIIKGKNEKYRTQINSSPNRAEIMTIDLAEIEKNFSKLLKSFEFSDYEKKEKPRTAKEIALKKAFETTFKSFIEEITEEYGKVDGGNVNYSFHIVGDINGDNVEDGYVRFSYSWGLLANANIGNAFFIYKDDQFEFLQSFDAKGFNFEEETPDCILGVLNNLIYATSSEYIDSDPRCCPSIEIKKVYKLIDNKIVEIYRIYSKAPESE